MKHRSLLWSFLALSLLPPVVTGCATDQSTDEATEADEFMLVSDVYDADLRLRALDIAAAVMAGAAERKAA